MTERQKLEQLYAEWARGDYSRSDIWAPDVEMETFGMAESQPVSGRDAIATAMADWLSAWERPLVIELDELVQRGDRILALMRWRGSGKESGVQMEAPGAHLWTFRDGLIVRFDVYRDRDDARAALESE